VTTVHHTTKTVKKTNVILLRSTPPIQVNVLISNIAFYFRATVTSNGRSPYATGPLSCLSCLSVTLVYCGQTVGWIKVPLGTKVGIGPGDVVLDGNLAPPWKGHSSPPHFSGPCRLLPNGRPSQQLLSCCLLFR